MDDWQAQQQQDEQQQIENAFAREWHCCYCGKPMANSFPQPADWQCCGEIGHIERLNEQGQWETP